MSILEEDFRELSQRLTPELSQLNGKSILLMVQPEQSLAIWGDF